MRAVAAGKRKRDNSCHQWAEKGRCTYGAKCKFTHNLEDKPKAGGSRRGARVPPITTPHIEEVRDDDVEEQDDANIESKPMPKMGLQAIEAGASSSSAGPSQGRGAGAGAARGSPEVTEDSITWVAALAPTALVHVRAEKGGRPAPLCRWRQQGVVYRRDTQEFPGVIGARNSGRAVCSSCLGRLPTGLRAAVQETLAPSG